MIDFRSNKSFRRQPHTPLSQKALTSDAAAFSQHFVNRKKNPRKREVIRNCSETACSMPCNNPDLPIQSIEFDSDDELPAQNDENTLETASCIFDFDFDDGASMTQNSRISEVLALDTDTLLSKQRKAAFMIKSRTTFQDAVRATAAEFNIGRTLDKQSNTALPGTMAFRCRDGFEGTEVIPNSPGLQYMSKRRRNQCLPLGSLPTKKVWQDTPNKKIKRAMQELEKIDGLESRRDTRELSCFGQLELTPTRAHDIVKAKSPSHVFGDVSGENSLTTSLHSVELSERYTGSIKTADIPDIFALRPLSTVGSSSKASGTCPPPRHLTDQGKKPFNVSEVLSQTEAAGLTHTSECTDASTCHKTQFSQRTDFLGSGVTMADSSQTSAADSELEKAKCCALPENNSVTENQSISSEVPKVALAQVQETDDSKALAKHSATRHKSTEKSAVEVAKPKPLGCEKVSVTGDAAGCFEGNSGEGEAAPESLISNTPVSNEELPSSLIEQNTVNEGTSTLLSTLSDPRISLSPQIQTDMTEHDKK
ncbi:hypothetical protein CFIMG_008345RA00001 [Ceratocystis fimbriata CBS 114723]|uniref:Uncharacterized protein n=1 Tax=Ceratocystis fimbriata CBS 114723 TaxID=1035309 RepID=A0A2C5WZB0_9PEZI|nr:hypothetical protein CFIMG_008345RA00001 [Ceratocystis fimbriata CBS 114723]